MSGFYGAALNLVGSNGVGELHVVRHVVSWHDGFAAAADSLDGEAAVRVDGPDDHNGDWSQADRNRSSREMRSPAFRHDHRLEGPRPITGNVDLHRADIGQHRLGPGPVAAVPAVVSGRVVRAIAQMLVELGLQAGLEHRLGQPDQ